MRAMMEKHAGNSNPDTTVQTPSSSLKNPCVKSGLMVSPCKGFNLRMVSNAKICLFNPFEVFIYKLPPAICMKRCITYILISCLY